MPFWLELTLAIAGVIVVGYVILFILLAAVAAWIIRHTEP